MPFEWDENKAARNLEVHKVSFEYATNIFQDAERRDLVDNKKDYGEERHIVFGEIEGRLFVVVYTLRDEVVRIISARKANEREVANHEAI